jgi:hypothetical protein
MNKHFSTVQSYLLELDYAIDHQNEDEGVFVISNESAGIRNLVIICAEPLLIMEQFLFEVKDNSADIFKNLLVKNRDIVHGAFALDETGEKVIFRDTLQIENLDLNELEGSINSLSLLLGEYSDELIAYAKH